MAEKQIVAIQDFSGGWNADSSPENLKDNELTLADNIDLDATGAASRRAGAVAINATSYAAQVEQIIEWLKDDGSSQVLAVVGTTLNSVNTGTGALTSVQALAGTSIGYVPFKGKFYFVDGGEYRQYNGTTVAAVTASTGADLTGIKRCKHLIRHPKSFRFFAAGDSSDQTALYYSEPGDPGSFNSATKKVYPSTAEGPIQALAVIGDAVLVFFQNGVYSWRGNDPTTDATWSKLPVGQGTQAPRCIVGTPSSLTFLGKGGLFSLTPVILDYTIVMEPGDDVVTNLAKNKVASVIGGIKSHADTRAVWIPQREALLIAYRDDGTLSRNNRVLVYHWRLGGFTRYTGLAVNAWCLRSSGELLIGTENYILRLTSDASTDPGDAAIPFKLTTKNSDLGLPYQQKKVSELHLAYKETTGVTMTLTATLASDYDEQTFSASSLTEGVFVWGQNWGGIWGTAATTAIRRIRMRAKALRHQITIENSDKLPFTLYGLGLECRGTNKKGEKLD